CVVRVPVLEGGDAGLDDVVGGREVGLPDLQVDDLLALGLELAGPGQHLERTFSAEPSHALRELDGHHANAIQLNSARLAPKLPNLSEKHPFGPKRVEFRRSVDARQLSAVDADGLASDEAGLLGAQERA